MSVRRDLSSSNRVLRVVHALVAFVTMLGFAVLSPAVMPAAAALPSGPTPLFPSNFQGGDGNQDDASSFIDWQTLQAQGRVVHSPDVTPAANSQFGSGDEQSPGNWTLTTEPATGATPAKNNILDGWSAVDEVGGNTFLYLGFTRDPEGNTGTTTVVFELNQEARTWNNGSAEIPCRRNGDLLVVFNAHDNDPTVDVSLQRWKTGTTDAASGCDATGTLVDAGSIPADSAQGSTNPGPIPVRLPGSLTTISDARIFGETALNLTKLFDVGFHDPCFTFGSIWMHTRASNSVNAALTDFIAPRPLVARTCAASGTKFLDLNANGRRDSGEPGLPRFVVFADYNDNGIRDANEPFTETGKNGNYVLNDIKPPGGGTYKLREQPLNPATDTSWICSFPGAGTPPDGFANGTGGLLPCGWGPIDPATEPNAQNRDFGNWLPAQLTLTKKLWPPTDPGRFDLIVNGTVKLASAGADSTITIPLRPGSYDVSEQAVAPTDPALYESSVSCRSTTQRRGRARSGPTFTNIVLLAGDQATCTFTNARPGQPAIAIEKTGPEKATAGDTLHYQLFVTNPGDVPLSNVDVTDPFCDGPPELAGKSDGSGTDNSPNTLDPGDTWTYTCSHRTSAPAGKCVISVVKNTATASGTPPAGATVDDETSIPTTIECPDDPPVPPLPPNPGPTPPTPLPPPDPLPKPVVPIKPAGPRVPPAGKIGHARLRILGRCFRRVSQARVVGTHISRIHVSVDGRPVALKTLRILQRRATLLHRVIRPGRHRVAVGVTFERGSGAPAVMLKRVVRVCARAARRPSVTG